MLPFPQIGNNTIKLPLRRIGQTNMANEHPENDINIVQLLKVAANILQTGEHELPGWIQHRFALSHERAAASFARDDVRRATIRVADRRVFYGSPSDARRDETELPDRWPEHRPHPRFMHGYGRSVGRRRFRRSIPRALPSFPEPVICQYWNNPNELMKNSSNG